MDRTLRAHTERGGGKMGRKLEFINVAYDKIVRIVM
jgi:hypothetical protein